MLTRTLSCLVLLTSLAAAQGNTWVVSNQNCPDLDFTELQDAIDFASDGDTILLRQDAAAAFGDFTINGKSLTIVGVDRPDSGTVLHFASRVVNIAAGQRVVLKGLDIVNGLDVQNCVGTVWLQDCDVTSSVLSGVQPAVNVISCSGTVTVVDSTLTGADAVSGGPNASAGARVIDGTLFLYDSTVRGGEGFTGPAPTFGAAGAIVREDGFLLVSGCDLVGGDAGEDTASPCNPLESGAGLLMGHVQTAAWTFGSTFTAGDPATGCFGGPSSLPVDGDGAFHLQDLGGPARGFAAPASGLEGDTINLDITPEPGDETFLLIAFDAAPIQLPGFHGAVLPSAGLGSLLLPLGALGGPVSLPVGLPTDLLGPGESVDLVLQALHLNGGEKFAGPGAVLTIHDAGLADAFECGSIWVDDDAPNDPAPGDTSVSDPLEDGSQAHPFDSIQEAIDAVAPGGRVTVRDGTYGSDSAPTLSFGGKGLVLESENGPDACIIQADQTAFSFGSEPLGTELRGLTIEGADLVAVRAQVASDIIINDCVIRDGEGVGVIAQAFARPLIRDSVIRGMGDGAVRAENASLPIIERCTLVGNTSAVVGAGLFARAGSLVTMNDTIVTGNSAVIGSGVFVEGSADISGCTIAHNPAGPGSELHITFGGLARVDNSILWGGVSPIHIQGTGALEIDWSDVKGGQAALSIGGSGGSVTWGANTIDVLPNFKDAAADDLHLKAGSPCRDAGDPSFDGSGRTDIDGQSRVLGGVVDMGADELP